MKSLILILAMALSPALSGGDIETSVGTADYSEDYDCSELSEYTGINECEEEI